MAHAIGWTEDAAEHSIACCDGLRSASMIPRRRQRHRILDDRRPGGCIWTGPKICCSTNTTAASTRRGRRWWCFRGRPKTWSRSSSCAHESAMPIVGRGAGTGLSGGAIPRAGRRDDRLRAHEPDSGNRSRERARRGPARRGQSGHHAGRAGRAATSTRPILPASAPAPSAATWPRTPAGRTRWPTA